MDAPGGPMLGSLRRIVASFRRPDGPALSDVPEVGDEAPERPRVGAGRPRVVLFLRHIGCAIGEAMLKDLRDASAAHPDVEFLAVTHGDSEAATDWCRDIGVGTVEVENTLDGSSSTQWCQDVEDSDIRLFVDPDRELYAEWGLGLGGANHLLDPRVFWRRLEVRFSHGAYNRVPSGSRWQRAGMFAVDGDGIVRAVHVADFAGDRPDIGVATTFLAGEGATEAASSVFDDHEAGWVVGESDAASSEEGEAVETPTSVITRVTDRDGSRGLPADREDLTPAAVPVGRSPETAEADGDERTRVRTDGGR